MAKETAAENTLAIAEIAGRDSVAAAVASVRTHGFSQLLPTIVSVGTEIGDFNAPFHSIETLARLLADECELLEPVELTEPVLWSALNGHFATVISQLFGIWSPCLACHLYMHLLRAPLSWELGNVPIISGERDTHDGRIKLSQTATSIDAAIRILAYGDITLLEPIRQTHGDGISELVGGNWEQDAAQLGCMLSGNYKNLDGSVTYDTNAHAHYLSDFFEPAGRAIIDAWRTEADGGPAPDWTALVWSILERNLP